MDQHNEANTRFSLLLERTQKPFRSFLLVTEAIEVQI